MPGGVIAVATTALGVNSANKQASAARKATAAQTTALDNANATQLAIAESQRRIGAPQIQAGAEAQARQMLMLGYTPDQVKSYLRSTSSAVNTPIGGAAPPPPPPPQPSRIVGRRGGFGSGFDTFDDEVPAQASPATSPDDYAWVDSYNPQAFLESTPGYQFRRDAGQKGLERSAAARGRLFSGATGTALDRYNQDYASGEWGNLIDQYGRIAGQGSDAASTQVNVLGAYGDSVSKNQAEAGRARASGYQAQGDAAVARNAAIARGAGSIYGLGKEQKWW